MTNSSSIDASLELTFARAAAGDGPEITALVNSAYRGDSSRAGWTTEAELLGGVRTCDEAIDEIIKSESHYLLTARMQGVLLGCCEVTRYSSTDAYIGMVTIRPTAQNQKLGRTMLAEAEKVAIQHFKATHARMTVISVRQELIAWYERRGYEDTKQREPFPMTDSRFGLPKVSHLEFIVMRKKLKTADQ